MYQPLIAFVFLTFYASSAFAVIGGDRAPELERHTVMILSKKGELCSGAVIKRDVVLTAAHCVHGGSEYAVFFREASGQPVLLDPKKIVIHPNYVRDAITRRVRSIDLAILKLKDPLPLNFLPVQLSDRPLRAGDDVTIGGYGLTDERKRSSNGQFFSSTLEVVEPYGPSKILLWLRGDALPQKGLNRGGCHGDSGGPLFDRDKLIAITTWTTGPKGFDCGDLTQGALLTPHIDWILKNAN